ncbi:MAG TPA: hypothetical protein PKX90_01705 [bacterium]|nr:hypothetical protein [bacterium]
MNKKELAKKRESAILDSRERAIRDRATEISYARREGIELGEKKGIEITALKMLKKGFDIKTISEITGLTEEEIKRLNGRKNNRKKI